MLEAMACGVPVITGNTSAMPEVAGEGALTVEPFKAEAIADALLRLETDTTLYEQQKAYGLHRVKKFSWKNTADELSVIYESLKP